MSMHLVMPLEQFLLLQLVVVVVMVVVVVVVSWYTYLVVRWVMIVREAYVKTEVLVITNLSVTI